MKAVQLDGYGSAENLRIVDLPVPRPTEDQVLIRVEAAGLIFADVLMRRGDYINQPSALPFVPGREVAGVVERVGARVTGLRPGMRVTAHMHTGGYAEYAVASAADVIALPDRVSFLQGLVYHINLRIAYLCYYTFGQIQPCDTVLLHAAAGGIGTLVTQIAKRRGRNVVIALSSSDDKLAHCRATGADYLVNYRATDYVDAVLRITGGRGVDVSLNSVGGSTLTTDPHVIRPMGRLVVYNYAAGRGLIDPFDVVLRKSLTISVFTTYTVFGQEEFRRATDFLVSWLHTEDLISVSRTFPLDDVVGAHRWLEEQRAHGKIALAVGAR